MKTRLTLPIIALASFNVLTVALAAPPTPVKLVASSTGHLGKQPSEQVVLQWAGGTEFVELFPDGTQQYPDPNNFDNCCYRVPEKRVLVITDVDWRYASGQRNQVQTLRLSINNLKKPALRTFPYQSTVTLNESGQGGSSQSMTSGFVMSSKARLGFDVIPGGGAIQAIVVRGYLAYEK